MLAVHPPGEIHQELLECILQKLVVRLTSRCDLLAVESNHCPRVDGGIHVSEVPLIRRHLAIGMEVGAAQDEIHLFLREVDVHEAERQGVKSQIPCGKPWVFPFVGHGKDVMAEHMRPFGVAGTSARSVRRFMLPQPQVASGTDRGRNSSTHYHRRCSLRGRFPTGAR